MPLLKRFGRYLLRVVLPPRPPLGIWDGIAWVIRMLLVYWHLTFAIPALIRPNLPLLFTGYSAFDDLVPFTTWGYAGLIGAAMMLLIPTRIPWGVISTLYTAFYMYLVGATFQQSGGLLPAVYQYIGMGLLSGFLTVRSLYALALYVPAFRRFSERSRHDR